MSNETDLFSRFGGVRPMATIVKEAPSTVQSWKDSGRIPATKQPKVLDRAKLHGIACSAEDVVFPLGRKAVAA